jgi:hypothetical protein
MIPVLLFGAAALSAIGWGAMLACLLRITPNNGERGILGLWSVGTIAGVVHVFAPVSSAVQAIMLVGGFAGLLIRRFDGAWAGSGLVALACLSVLLHDNILTFYDNGLYHMQTFLWNTNAPLTPGLANLHQRLGYNSLLFLIVPIVDLIQFGWIANGLTAAFVIAAMLERLWADGRSLSDSAFWFLVCTVVIFAWSPVWFGWLGVLNADGVTAALVVYCVYLWFEYLQGLRTDTTPSLLVIISTFAILVKLSAIPLILASVGLWMLCRQPYPARRVFLAAGLGVLLWTGRGLVLSGCAVYPLPQTCVHSLPWTIAPFWPDFESIGIRSWARSPGRMDYQVVLASWDWFEPWYARVTTLAPITALLWTVPVGAAALLLRLLTRRRVEAPALYVASILICCITWWFWAAPDPRFGSGFLASMSIVSLGMALCWGPLVPSVRRAACYLVLGTLAVFAARDVSRNSWRGAPTIPVVLVKLVAGPQGISIRVPIEGAQCWNQPIPCVPPFHLDQQAFSKVRWRTRPASSAPTSR